MVTSKAPNNASSATRTPQHPDTKVAKLLQLVTLDCKENNVPSAKGNHGSPSAFWRAENLTGKLEIVY